MFRIVITNQDRLWRIGSYISHVIVPLCLYMMQSSSLGMVGFWGCVYPRRIHRWSKYSSQMAGDVTHAIAGVTINSEFRWFCAQDSYLCWWFLFRRIKLISEENTVNKIYLFNIFVISYSFLLFTPIQNIIETGIVTSFQNNKGFKIYQSFQSGVTYTSLCWTYYNQIWTIQLCIFMLKCK